MVNLIGYKATVVIFDLNGEYGSIGMTNDGKRNMYYDKIHTLTPSQNFKVAIDQLHLNTVIGILVNALHLTRNISTRIQTHMERTQRTRQTNLQNLAKRSRTSTATNTSATPWLPGFIRS